MNKVTAAIKEGRLLKTANNKIKQTMSLYRVSDSLVVEELKQTKTLAKLAKKYSYVLEAHDYSKTKTKKSKYVWMLWLQGERNAPKLVKACIASTRKLFSDFECVVLDEGNLHKYIELPSYIVEKYKSGAISNAHYSDIIRAALLSEKGGIWMDATVYCTAKKVPDYIEKTALFAYKDIKLPLYKKSNVAASSWLISSESKNSIMTATYDLLKEYWQNEDSLCDYFLFHLFFKLATDYYFEEWKNVPSFSNVPPHIMQTELNSRFDSGRWSQLCAMSDFHKLNHHIEFDADGTVCGYILGNS